MNIIKRTFSGLFSQIDGIVGEIENHDALIKAAIKDQQKKLAAAKVQLARIKSHELQIKQQIAEQSLNEKRWAKRAKEEAVDNEAQALLCLERRSMVKDKLEKLERMLKQYQQTSAKIKADINRCEDEFKTMQQKHALMRARQSSAEAANIVSNVSSSNLDDIETSFDRWEVKIAQGEINMEITNDSDELEQMYLTREREELLKDELAELLKEGVNHE